MVGESPRFSGEEARLLQGVARALQARGSLVPNEHGGLMLGGDAPAILKGDAALMIVRPPENVCAGRRGATNSADNPVGDPLFEALRALRRDLAVEGKVPPYVIFHDATLRAMAAARPTSRAALGAIEGVGAKKLDAYGAAFLKAIAEN